MISYLKHLRRLGFCFATFHIHGSFPDLKDSLILHHFHPSLCTSLYADWKKSAIPNEFWSWTKLFFPRHWTQSNLSPHGLPAHRCAQLWMAYCFFLFLPYLKYLSAAIIGHRFTYTFVNINECQSMLTVLMVLVLD